MAVIISLAEMRTNESGKVVRIEGGWGMTRKLESIGVRVGSQITKVSGQFMRGPVVIAIGNTQLAIGFGMAQRVFVEVKR